MKTECRRTDASEHRRIDVFELRCWRRLSTVPWTGRRSKQSIPKEMIPKYSLEGLMLKLKCQYFGHLMQKIDSLEKIMMLGMIEGKSKRGQQRIGWFDIITNSVEINCSNSRRKRRTEEPGMLQSMGSQQVGYNL